jgi:RHS repeat-associated protein
VTDSKGQITAQDHVNLHFAVDSPINVNALRWVQRPRLCYSTAGGTCDTKKPDLTAPVDTDIYPDSTGSEPQQPWHSTVSGDSRLRINYSVGDLSKVTKPGKIVLTVKTAADGYVLKKEIDPTTDTSPVDVTMSFTKGTDYWFDLSMLVPGLGEKVSGTSASVLPKGGTDPADTVSVPLTVNTVGRQGYFPLAYRGWGVAGYLANEDRGGKALVQGDFDIVSGGKPFADSDSACKAVTGGACKTSKSDVDGMTFPGSYSNDPNADQTFDPNTVTSRFAKAYGYVPEVGTDASALITETWKGPIDHLFATRVGLASALLGGALPPDDGSNGLTPPQLEGSTGPVLAAMLGLGPASASFAFGWSRSFVDYMDMNGDGFPDKVTTDSVTYTNPRGGQGCKQQDGSFTACSITRNGAVNQDTSFAVGGGLSGAPVGIKGNARGVPNATQGAAAGKGGGASTDEYGAGIGAGVGVSATFGSPNAANPGWDTNTVDPNTTKLPGDPVHNDSTLAIQQVLADVNGDGLPDLVKTTPKGVFVYFNLGYGFADNSVPWASGGFESSEAYSGSFEFGLGFAGPGKDFSFGVSHNAAINFPRYSWADVNGDGILDAMHRDDTNGTVQIAYGTGTGLMSPTNLGVDGSVPFRLAGQIRVPIKDQIRQDQSVGYGAGADVTIGFGPLCIVACYLIVNPGVHYENSLSLSDVDLVDVNGDGFPDSVRRVVADSGQNQEKLDVQLNTHGRTGLLKTITNPFHGVTTLDYDRYGNTADHPGSLYALSKVSVDDKRPGDGVDVTTTSMSYQGMAYDFLRRQDLGFARVESDELATNGDVLRSTVETYRNDNVFDSGLLVDTTVYDGPVSAGKRLQRTADDWNVLNGATQATLSLASLTPDESLAIWGVPEKVDEAQQLFGPDGTTVIQSTSTHFSYDALGAPTTIFDRGDPANPADDLTATIQYSDCAISADSDDQKGKCTAQAADATQHPAFWSASLCPTWVHTAARYTVTDSNGAVVRYRDGAPALCDNDSVTVLNELISGPISGGTYATTQLQYDDWGSYNRIVYPAGTDGSHYAVRYVYDDNAHANVAHVTDYQLTDAEADDFINGNPDDIPVAARIGLMTNSVYDGPSGKVASTTDANGAKTTYAYDPMGRLAATTTPDHQTVTYAYDPGNAAYGYATAKHSDAFGQAGATIDTATFVDGTGRVTQQKRTAEFYNGPGGTAKGFVVSPAVAVDALGHEVEQWFPQKQLGGSLTDYQAPPSDSAPHTVTVYDKLDRVTSVTDPANHTTTTAYSATTDLGRRLSETVVTDPLLRVTRTLTDVRGLVRASEDRAVNKPPVRTDYDYTPLGDLTKVATGGVTQSESTYDLLGNRLSTDTPDGGLTTWTYNPAGQQETSQSAEQFAASTKTTYRYAFQNLVSIDYQNALPTVTLGYGGYDGVSKAGNGAGQLVSVKDSARTQQLTYDVNGQQASETTAMNDPHWTRGNVTTSFVHDYLGRLGSVTYIDGETVTNHYDTGGSLASITGAKACTDLGTLAAAIDATQTTISINETPHAAAPVLPFTMSIGGEQVRVTARVPGPNGTFTYTVDRGINSTPLVPTAAPHPAGSTLATDVALTCAYRYLDRQEYDEFGDIAFRQLGNSNQSWSQRDPNTRALSRIVSTAPSQGTSIEGTLAASATTGAGTLTVNEAYAPPPVPFTAQVGTETVTVTNRVATAVKGTFSYTVSRGQGGTTAVAHASGEVVLTDRVQQNLTYAYDAVGNLTSYANDLPVDTTSLFGGKSQQTYSYDPYYRVKSASGSWDTAPSTQRDYSLTLSYDDTSGNLLLKDQKDWTLRTSCTKNCKTTPVDATSYTVSPGYQSPQQHQFSTFGADTYTYDRNGDVTSISNPANLRQMTWDATGHLTMIVDRPNGTGGKPTYYTYDYRGSRAIETKETGRTWFVNQWTTVKDGTLWKNIWAGDERLGTKFSETGTYEHKSYWFQKDLQGSTNVVSDETGSMFQHREYFPDGQIWVDESSTIFRSPYMAQGNYFDEDHNLSDFGQRWFDPRSQTFLSADPAAYDDPTGDITDPTAAWSFTFARGNPLVVGDPDGRVGKFINPTVVQRDALTKALTIDGKPLTTTEISAINHQLALHRGLKGKLLFGALSNIDKAQKIKALTEKFSTKPLLEFTFDLGANSLKTTKLKNVKLESIKLGAGVGPRKKFTPPAKTKPAAQKNPQKSNGAGGNP